MPRSKLLPSNALCTDQATVAATPQNCLPAHRQAATAGAGAAAAAAAGAATAGAGAGAGAGAAGAGAGAGAGVAAAGAGAGAGAGAAAAGAGAGAAAAAAAEAGAGAGAAAAAAAEAARAGAGAGAAAAAEAGAGAGPPRFAIADNELLGALCEELRAFECLEPLLAVGAAAYRDGHVSSGVALGLAMGLRGMQPFFTVLYTIKPAPLCLFASTTERAREQTGANKDSPRRVAYNCRYCPAVVVRCFGRRAVMRTAVQLPR